VNSLLVAEPNFEKAFFHSAAPRAASSPSSLAIFTLLEKAALFEAASSSPEPKLHAPLLAGAFPFAPASPSPGVRLWGSDEWKNLLRQTAPEHGVHAAAGTPSAEIPGLAVREPGPPG